VAASKSEKSTFASIPELVAFHALNIPNSPAYREKEYGIWQSWSWSEAAEEIDALALGFLTLGVAKGDYIAIIGRNRPHFYWSMIAAQSVGAIPVPVYQDAVAEELVYVLDHCGAKFVLAENQEQVDKVLEIKKDLKALEHIIFLDNRGMRKYDRANLHDFRDLQNKGRNSEKKFAKTMASRRKAIKSSDTCVMLYTSGTTGRPKGVILSNHNIIKTSEASSSFDLLNVSDDVLAYLPMAWVGDFIFSIGQACWTGFCVSCPENIETMQQDLKEIGPTYFFAPPRYFEGLLTNVMIRMEDASAVKRFLFSYFMAHAQKIGGNLLDGHSVSVIDKLKYAIGQLFIYGPLRNTLGLSNVRVGYTAGEAIGPEIFDFYRSIGINLKQLYGQTEASVYITQQPDGQVRSDTVGIASPGVELKISDSGEVFYRSPGTFVEYFKNPKSTKETKDAEGWVATGDAGFIEADTGHLRIIDRAKDVGKMEDGRLFAPKYVENKLKFFPNVLECVVFGAGRKFCTAFINIDLNAVGNWAERNNIAYSSYQELAGHKNVYEMIKDHINETNESLADDDMLSGCQIHRFVILHKELDADDGELTRTRKVRRRVIEDKFHNLINALYDGSSEVYTETEVTYEDGAKGAISATLAIADVKPVVQKGKAA
jgi:long-chain acyl-CoA synthetase